MDHASATAITPRFEPIAIDPAQAQKRIKDNMVIVRLALAILSKTEAELADGMKDDAALEVTIDAIDDFSGCLEWLGHVAETVTTARARLIACLPPSDDAPEVVLADRPENLIDLCRRCVEALAANEAIYNAVPRGVDISDKVARKASAHYRKQVVPLLKKIETTPAKTLEEVVSKARIWMSDRIQLCGEAHMDSACVQFLVDLSALDLVPEVPEAPYYKPAAKPDATQEAA